MSNKYNGKYPAAWSEGDIAFYEQVGREPDKTSNGLWVSDKTREAKALVDWTLAELYALANNELLTEHSSGSEEFYKVVRAKALLEHKDALNWGEEDLYEWLLFERTPAKSPNGYYINDPERWVKDAALWNDSELVDLGMGYFGEPSKRELYILDEACGRFDLPLGITWEDYCTYIKTSVKPELTSTGVLINDRHRATKSIDDWSEAELKAYALGEIETDSTDKALLAKALETFGGEWYWDRLSLMVWVGDGEIPEFVHAYDEYTDDQLKRLIRETQDAEAIDVLEVRHIRELADWWTTEQRLAYLLDGIEPVAPVVEEVVEDEPETEPEPEEPEDVPEESLAEAEPEVADVIEEALPETEPEPSVEVRTLEWTDLVAEGTELFDAMAVTTSEAIIADEERRQYLTASKWSLAELVAWARDLIPSGMNTTASTLVSALRRHCDAFTANWTDDAVKQFIGFKMLPEGLGKGMLVHDAVRDRTHPGDWSDAELRAYFRNEIQSTRERKEIWLSAWVRFNVPSHFTDEQALDYITTGVKPVEEVAPIVAGTPISIAQLDAWLAGTLKVEDAAVEETLFATARQHYKIDVRWTDSQILTWFRNGTEPRTVEGGIQIEDRMRDSSSPANWNWKELRALALGLIEADFDLRDQPSMERIRRLIDVQFGVRPAHWSDDEVLDYLRDQTVPKALENGVYINDPTRARKQAVEWRDAELKAWLKGEIVATEKATEPDLWEEVYVRFKVPVFWYQEDARSYVLDRAMVPSTLSGIWVRDRNRDARKASHWTRREIKAWCRGQILPGINAPADDLLKRAVTLFGLSHYLDADTVKKRISEITEESMTMTVKFVDEDLKSYEAGRKEAGDNGTKAAPYQSLLERCINRVLRLDGEDFVQGWTELLNFFHKNSKDICSPKKIYVGVGQMAITPKGLRTFQNMTSILSTTCDPSTRDRSVKQIDWTAALKDVANEKARQNVLSYYGQ